MNKRSVVDAPPSAGICSQLLLLLLVRWSNRLEWILRHHRAWMWSGILTVPCCVVSAWPTRLYVYARAHPRWNGCLHEHTRTHTQAQAQHTDTHVQNYACASTSTSTDTHTHTHTHVGLANPLQNVRLHRHTLWSNMDLSFEWLVETGSTAAVELGHCPRLSVR